MGIRMKKKFWTVAVLVGLLCGLILTGCGKEETTKGNVCQVYYISTGETKVEMHTQVLQATELEEKVQELLEYLGTNPEKLEYKAPLSLGFQVKSIRLEDGRLTLDMDEGYDKLSVTTEVLVRAALVRTFTQFPDISYVMITKEGKPIYDNAGSMIGWMNGEMFIDNDGNEINTYELAKVKLYFASQSGTKLIATYREKHYSTNTPLERFVVEELIAGPSGQVEGIYPSVNSSTKIINVLTKDGICYVNLDDNFLTVENNVPTEVSIYALVNSLVELNNVNKVQILINGEVPASFSATTYERNLDIVTNLEE